MATPPCSFYKSPRGCFKGKDCKFAHVNTTTVTSRSPSGPSGPSTPRGHNSGLHPNESPPTSLPAGVCRFYWTRGECKREFECRYRHIRPDSDQEHAPSPSPRSTLLSSSAAREMIIPFLTEKGLAKLNGNATDGFFAGSETSFLSPTEAHGRLKRFLLDNFRFKTSFEIYAFLVPLSSANSSNTKWVSSGFIFLYDVLTC